MYTVVCGAAIGSTTPTTLASSYRYCDDPTDEDSVNGFRVASVPEPGSIALLVCGADCRLDLVEASKVADATEPLPRSGFFFRLSQPTPHPLPPASGVISDADAIGTLLTKPVHPLDAMHERLLGNADVGVLPNTILLTDFPRPPLLLLIGSASNWRFRCSPVTKDASDPRPRFPNAPVKRRSPRTLKSAVFSARPWGNT